jgi:hypothetical protein
MYAYQPLRLVVASLVATLSLSQWVRGAPIDYTNYIDGMRIGGTAASALWTGSYVSGPNPFAWYVGADDPAAPFWGPNARVHAEYQFLAGPDVNPDLVGTIPYAGTWTVEAFDPGDPLTVLGTMNWSASGAAPIDFNAARAVVDTGAGLIYLRWGQPFLPAGQPAEMHAFLSETGLFASDGVTPVGDEAVFLTGLIILPLDPSIDLQTNIFGAPIIGATAELAAVGQYVPEPTGIATAIIVAVGILALRRSIACSTR